MRKNMNATEKTVETNTVTMTESALAQTVLDGALTICGKKIAAVPVSLLRIDKSYQREPNSENVQNLIKEWDINLCDFLDVSYRDGLFNIINGQHRFTAGSYVGVPSLPCMIRTGLTRSQEAIIFARQNRNVKKLYPYDTYKANIQCGDTSYPEVKVDMAINRICSAHNIEVKKVGRGTKENKVLRCLFFARRIVRANGSDSFEWVIDTICNTNWENCSDAYTQAIVRMLNDFYIENRDNISAYEEFVKKAMNSTTPMQILALSKADYPEYSIQVGLNICFKKLVDSYNIKAVKNIKAVS